MPTTIPIHNIGAIGIIKDIPSHLLVPEAWSDGNNVRFQDNNAIKFKGHSQVFGTPTVVPGFLLNVPTAAQNYWIYTSLTKAYVFEGGVHTNITRQSAGVDVNYTASQYREWNGGILGGIPILNNGSDVPQYWPTLSVATKLVNLTNWPSTMRAEVVRPFGPFLVALNILDGSTVYPHMVWWSHPADPGAVPSSWDYTDPTKDAGRRELTDVEGGPILDAMMLRNLLIIYKETSTHYMRYVGGQEIMGTDQLFTSTGILAARCAVPMDRGKKHFVATGDDLVVHNGQEVESIADSRWRKFIQTDLDTTNYPNSFCVHNPAQREVWFCYPSSGNTLPNRALVWNYTYRTIQVRDFDGIYGVAGTAQTSTGTAWSALTNTWDAAITPWSTEGRRQLIVASSANTKIFKMDDTETHDGTNKTSYIERTGLAIIGRDRQGQPKVNFNSRKLLSRIWPKISGSATVSVRCGAQESLDGAVNWQAAQNFNPATQQYLDFTANGRLLAVRFETTGALSWQLDGYDIEVEEIGAH